MGEKHKQKMFARALRQSKSPLPALGGSEEAGSKWDHGEGVHNVRLVSSGQQRWKSRTKRMRKQGKNSLFTGTCSKRWENPRERHSLHGAVWGGGLQQAQEKAGARSPKFLGNQTARPQAEVRHQEKPPLQEGETTSKGFPEGSPSLEIYKIWLAKAMANPTACWKQFVFSGPKRSL